MSVISYIKKLSSDDVYNQICAVAKNCSIEVLCMQTSGRSIIVTHIHVKMLKAPKSKESRGYGGKIASVNIV